MLAVLSPTKQGTCKILDGLLKRGELTVCLTLFLICTQKIIKRINTNETKHDRK